MQPRNRLSKDTLESFLMDQLVPALDDQEWLLYDKEMLLKIRDEVLFGLGFTRDDWNPSFRTFVFIAPLYRPGNTFVTGMGEHIGRWLRKGEGGEWKSLATPQDAEDAATVLAGVINRRIIPFFAQLTGTRAVLQYRRRHPTDPMLGWLFTSPSGDQSSELGYMAAWVGNRQAASSYLRVRLSHLAGNTSTEANEERAHIQETLRFLDSPAQLRSFLEETADRQRVALKLDRARPIPELLAERRGHLREEQTDP